MRRRRGQVRRPSCQPSSRTKHKYASPCHVFVQGYHDFNKKSALNLHRSYILAPTQRPAGLRSPRERTGARRTGSEIQTNVHREPWRRSAPSPTASPSPRTALPSPSPPAGCGTVPCARGRIGGSWWRRGRSRWAPPGGCSAHPDTAAPGRRRCGRMRRRWPCRRQCRCASPMNCSWPATATSTSELFSASEFCCCLCRTEGEFAGGHPAGAVNVPYMYSTGSGMAKNSHFVEQVSAIFGMDDEIIIGCQSGKRSLMAAAELCSASFSAVTDMAGGFSTWRENGLPVNGR